MREFDNHGQLPTRIDIGSYIFGTSITTLTTVRCDPLLADWRQLYAHFNIKRNSTIAELKKMEKIHNDYKFRLVELAQEFFDENMARPVNRRSNTMNPCTHASSVSV